MKRLMVMLSAAAMAFGLFAADDGHVAGTGFESDGIGAFEPEEGWTLPTGDDNRALTVTAYGAEEAPTITRPAQYNGDNNANFLDVKTTFGKPVELNVSGATMGGIYFDSLVKFTACDEAPSADSYSDAKLIVYTLENEEGGQKIFVRAGQIADGVVPFDYDCGTWDKGDAWVRLTIKTIGNVAAEGSVPAFVVFVDGTPLGSAADRGVSFNSLGNFWMDQNGAKCCFPSLVQGGAEAGTIAAAGFDGQGKIDDLSFTTTVPTFCADPAFFTVTWDDKVVVTSYQVNGGSPVPLTDAQKTAMTVAIPYIGAATVSVVAEPAEGCVIKNVTAENGASWDGEVFTIDADATAPTAVIEGANATPVANIVIEGVTDPVVCYSFADAVAALNNAEIVGSGAKATLALVDDVTGVSEIISSQGIVTIDLAGKTITGDAEVAGVVLSLYGNAVITDTSVDKTGKIIAVGSNLAAVGAYANAENDTLTISGGTYDGLVYVDAGDEGAGYPAATLVIAGESKFSAANSTEDEPAKFLYAGNVADDFQAADALDANNFWVVAPKAVEKHGWAIYLAEGDNENEFLIQNKQDLIELATWANKTDEDGETFPTEGITFKQTADIELTDPFAGIGQSAVKDIVNDKNNGDASAFLNGAFKGTYDGGNYTISGFIHVGGDYDGFINSAYGATIKNIRISLGSATGVAADKTGNVLGVIAGFTVDTLVENCVTLVAGDYNTFKTDKTAAGIVCYASDGTVIKDCTNNLNIVSGGNEKAGGLVACAQQVVNTNVSHEGTGETIENCANYGNVTAKDGTTRAAGLVSYTDNAVTFKGENIVGKDVTISPDGQSVININGGSATVEAGAVIKVPAGILSTRHNGKAHAGLNYAMVDDGVATFVADSALAANGVYKVMATDCKPIIELEKDETITFDETLATIDATGITTAEPGYEVTKNDNTYAVTVKTYNITFTSQEGTTAPAAMTYTVESTFPLELADATTANVGTEFKGWTNATYTTAIKAIPALPETLGDIALVAQWDAVVGPAGWDPEADPTVPASEKGITGDLAKASFKALSTWATKYGVTFADNVDQYKDAFLLNCAPDAVETAKAAFKIANIAQGDDGWVVTLDDGKGGTIYNDGDYGNGKVVIESFSDVACTKTATEGDQLFYKAKLVVKEVGATK